MPNNWHYYNADIDPAHKTSGVLSDLSQPKWRTAHGEFVSLSDTPLINLYNLQVYIDKRLESCDNIVSISFYSRLEYYNTWSKLVLDEIKGRTDEESNSGSFP
jgi:hypothetical protein